MTKDELIKALEKIPGNPDVVVEYIKHTRNGPLVEDWLEVCRVVYNHQHSSPDVILEVDV